jgi:EAL domain-containing protein (putative c-di-GMP-specific phosphodiesterase class I)
MAHSPLVARMQSVTAEQGLGRSRKGRDRFVVFAFAAAELLLEADLRGHITFAEGAFPARFGRPAKDFLGQRLTALIAPADRPAFATALSLLAEQGRLKPAVIKLADAAATPFSVAGLRLDDGEAKLVLTFAPLPRELPGGPLPGGPGLASMAEEILRSGEAGGPVGFLELKGPAGRFEPGIEVNRQIQAELNKQAGEGAIATELAAGRYGVLPGQMPFDLPSLTAAVADILKDRGVRDVSVGAMAVGLEAEGLNQIQATRALRFALAAFARGGNDALEKAGFAGGLAGFLDSASERATLLRRSIAERRFRMAFQPIVSLTDRTPHHYEALIRPLQADDTAMSDPGEFVALAEAVGLTEELDWAVVSAVCEAAGAAGGTRVACNLSGLSLQSPKFREDMKTLLENTPGMAERLVVEITETAEIEQEDEAVRMIDLLREHKIPVCLDDFGAGAAAFRYLRIFKVDYVKVDGIYVANALQSERDRGFISAMVDLARTVGAQVVAERIETEEEAALMLELGVRYGQGYLFGRPKMELATRKAGLAWQEEK